MGDLGASCRVYVCCCMPGREMESLQLDGRDYNQTGEITTVTWVQDGRVYNQRCVKTIPPRQSCWDERVCNQDGRVCNQYGRHWDQHTSSLVNLNVLTRCAIGLVCVWLVLCMFLVGLLKVCYSCSVGRLLVFHTFLVGVL